MLALIGEFLFLIALLVMIFAAYMIALGIVYAACALVYWAVRYPREVGRVCKEIILETKHLTILGAKAVASTTKKGVLGTGRVVKMLGADTLHVLHIKRKKPPTNRFHFRWDPETEQLVPTCRALVPV